MAPLSISLAFRSAVLTGALCTTFTATVFATEFQGSLKEISITSSSAANKPPTVAFRYSNNGGAFTFDASGSTDPDGSITEYQWDFGNNSKGTGVTALTTYNPGTYAVTLTVVDDDQGVTIAQKNIYYEEGFVLEDAEDGSTTGWTIYDNTPEGATIANEFDSTRNGRVISFTGSGTDNGFSLAKEDGTALLIKDKTSISLGFRTWGSYTIYVQVTTSAGIRFLTYSGADINRLGTSTYIDYGLGKSSMDGTWQNFTRNIQTDLTTAQPGVSLTTVDKILVRGTIKIDEIILN